MNSHRLLGQLCRTQSRMCGKRETCQLRLLHFLMVSALRLHAHGQAILGRPLQYVITRFCSGQWFTVALELAGVSHPTFTINSRPEQPSNGDRTCSSAEGSRFKTPARIQCRCYDVGILPLTRAHPNASDREDLVAVARIRAKRKTRYRSQLASQPILTKTDLQDMEEGNVGYQLPSFGTSLSRGQTRKQKCNKFNCNWINLPP